ncbi:hypothetical protein BaRGS_00027380 [Batillaria attramentaria]|uniref:Msx2-interacting protein-like n=1 Tax=Batillaria attramentaria TaxID=370345 RepID=A0ABD0K304_9CAEN
MPHIHDLYGKIQSVKLQPSKDNDSTLTATVAFMDIRSASKAHLSKNTIDNAVLLSRAGSGNAGSFTGSWTSGGNFRHAEGARAQADTNEKERFDRSRSSPDLSTTSSSHIKKSVSMSRSVSRSRSRSPRSRSGSSSSRTYSSESSKSCSNLKGENPHGSSQGSARPQSTIGTLKSTIASEIKDPKADRHKDSDCDDKRPLGICITGLPARSSDSSLRDGLFHNYKKHGKVTSVQIATENGERYAIVSFRKPEDACKALEASQGKMFFGTKIKVSPHEGVKSDDVDIRTGDMDMDEFHPKATRTLFIGNLEKDTSVQDLLDKFGTMLTSRDKEQPQPTHLCSTLTISSVVRALQEMEGEHIGANKIKLGFGKSMPTNCVWIDSVGETISEKSLGRVFKKYGEMTYTFIDRKKWRALVFFTNLDDAQYAVNDMKTRTINKRKIMVDFASRECQNNFLDKMEKSGQLRPENRPDERGLHKFRQRSFEFQEGFTEENSNSRAGTRFPNPWNRQGRGRSRFNDSTFPEEFSPARRNSRQSSEFSQSGSFYKNVDDYELELREYGHSQRERRERGHSPRRDEFDDRSRRSSREVSLDRYENKDRLDYTRSNSPGSEHNSFRSERFVTRTVEDKSFRDKFNKEKSEDKVLDRLGGDTSLDLRGHRSPVFVSGRSMSGVEEIPSDSPPTPTQEEQPIFRTFYPEDNDDDDFTPTYAVIEPSKPDPKPKLKSVWVSQAAAVSASPAPSISSKLGSEVTLPEKSSVRKRVHEDTVLNKDSSKKKSDKHEGVGSLTLKLTPAERQRQKREQSRRLGSGKGFGKSDKSDARSRLKVLEGTLSSPGSSGSHPESENGSVNEVDMLNLQRKKQLLLDKLDKLTQQEDRVTSADGSVDDDISGVHGSKFTGSDWDSVASVEELMKIDSKQGCRKQMEQIAKMEMRLKEKHREKLLALQAAGGRSSRGDVDFKITVPVDSSRADSTGSSPSDVKRRKLELPDNSSDVSKHTYHKGEDIKPLTKDSRSVLDVSGCGVGPVDVPRSSSGVFGSRLKDSTSKTTKSVCESNSDLQDKAPTSTGYPGSNKQSSGSSRPEKLGKGAPKHFLPNSSAVHLQEKSSYSPKFGPSPEACFSPTVSEEPPDLESNNSESLTEKSSPKHLSPLGDWPQQPAVSPGSKGLSDDDLRQLDSKDEPGLLSLAHVDDSLSDTSEDEKVKLDEPSLEERIRKVDEIMQATMNKTSDVTLLNPTSTGGPGALASPNNMGSSLYSKYRVRKRDEKSGQDGLGLERKSEPSVIVQQLLSKRSILDQDFQRLGQLGEKYEPPVTVGVALGGRPGALLHSKLKDMPTLQQVGLPGQPVLAGVDSSVAVMPALVHPPVTTATASMQLPTTTTTMTMAGQQVTTVTTSILHPARRSPVGSLTVPTGTPAVAGMSPRHYQPAPHLPTSHPASAFAGSHSPCATASASPLVMSSSPKLPAADPPMLEAVGPVVNVDRSHVTTNGEPDSLRIPSIHERRSPQASSSSSSSSVTSNHVPHGQTLPTSRVDDQSAAPVSRYPNGSRSPRVMDMLSVNVHSPAAAATPTASPLPKKDVSVNPQPDLPSSRPAPSTGKTMDTVQSSHSLTVPDRTSTPSSPGDDKVKHNPAVLAPTKGGEKDSGRHRESVFQALEEMESNKTPAPPSSRSAPSQPSVTQTSVIHSTPSSTSIPTASTSVTTGSVTSTTSSSVTSSSGRSRGDSDRQNKSSKTTSRSLDQGVKHDPLFAPDIKPDPPTPKPESKPLPSKEKEKKESDSTEKRSQSDSVVKTEPEVKEKKSHSKTSSSSSHSDKKVSKSSSRESTGEKKEPEVKQEPVVGQKLSDNKSRQDVGPRAKNKDTDVHNKLKDGDGHVKNKENPSHSKSREVESTGKNKETSDSNPKSKDSESVAKSKDVDSHGKTRDKKADMRGKSGERDSDSHGKNDSKDTDSNTKPSSSSESHVKSKDKEQHGKSTEKETEPRSKSKDRDSEVSVKSKDSGVHKTQEKEKIKPKEKHDTKSESKHEKPKGADHHHETKKEKTSSKSSDKPANNPKEPKSHTKEDHKHSDSSSKTSSSSNSKPAKDKDSKPNKNKEPEKPAKVPVYTSMYDTIKRRSCKKVNQMEKVSDDTRMKLTQLKSRRGSTKKSKSSKSFLDDSSSDESDSNLLSLESDSQDSDSDTHSARGKAKKKPQPQPLSTKKKRPLVLSSSSDDEDEEDETALLRMSKSKPKSSQPKKFHQIFNSSSSEDDLDRDSSPERPPPKPKAAAKPQEKKSKPKKPVKKRKSTEESNNDSDIPDLQPAVKVDSKSSSHLASVSEISMAEDTMDETSSVADSLPKTAPEPQPKPKKEEEETTTVAKKKKKKKDKKADVEPSADEKQETKPVEPKQPPCSATPQEEVPKPKEAKKDDETMLAEDMQREEKKLKDTADKCKNKQSEEAKDSSAAEDSNSLVAETETVRQLQTPPEPEPEEPEDPFVSFWGHPAPILHKKRDSIPRAEDGKEKDEKDKKKTGDSPASEDEGKPPSDDKKGTAGAASDSKPTEVKKPAWDLSVFAFDQETPVKPVAPAIDQEPKLLIDIPVDAFKPDVDETPEKSDDVIDKKGVFPERRFSLEDKIGIPKNSSPLFMREGASALLKSPPHGKTDSRKQIDSKMAAESMPDPTYHESENDIGVFTPFTKEPRREKVVSTSSTEKPATVLQESNQDKAKQDQPDEGLSQLERDEIAMQEASDEAARAVECLLGFQEENNQFSFNNNDNDSVHVPPTVLPGAAGIVDTGTTLSSPPTVDSVALQSQPNTLGPEIHEASEAPQPSSQPEVQEQSLSVMQQQQEQEAEVKAEPAETNKKGQRRGKRQNRSKGSRDTPQKGDLNQQDMPGMEGKGVFPGQSPPYPVPGETQLPSMPDMSKLEGPELKRNPIDAYDFDAQMNQDDAGSDLIVESALSGMHGSSSDDQAPTMKSPRRRNSSRGGRGRRGRGGTIRETLEKMGKTEQPPASPLVDQTLPAPTPTPTSVPTVPQAPAIPVWQQEIVKADLASPDSKTDLDSSYGDAELVINLDDQNTPTDGEDRVNKGQYQFGSDTEEKSPAQLASTAAASPYKTSRSTRTRKTPNYKAMDQGLGMRSPSPRASRSGSSPRGARGGQSPKNTSTPRGRGSPKTSTEFGSPVVKLDRLEVGRGKKKDESAQRGRPGGKDSEGIEDVMHTTFEDWKAANLSVDQKPVSKENIYDFADNEQEQKLEPSPVLRGPRGRNKRPSDGGETNMGKPLDVPPVTAALAQAHPQQPPVPVVLKDLQEEQAQASDDSSSSMSNVDKIIDAVSKGFFDYADSKKPQEETGTRPAAKGRGGARNAQKNTAVEPEPKTDAVAAGPSTANKPPADFTMPESVHDEPPVAAANPVHPKAGKAKQDMQGGMSFTGELPPGVPRGMSTGFTPSSAPPDVAAVGQLSKSGSLMKPEPAVSTTMAWQSAVTTASTNTSKPVMQHPDVPHSIAASMAGPSPHVLPPPPHSAPDVVSRMKKEGVFPPTSVHDQHPLPPVSTAAAALAHQHAMMAEMMAMRGAPGREDASPLAQIAYMSSMQPGMPPVCHAEHARRTGVFAIREPTPASGMVTGPASSRGGSHEPRYTSPKVSSAPVNVITTSQHGPITTSSGSNTSSHSKHTHSQPSPKLPHGMPKGWVGSGPLGPGPAPGQQQVGHTSQSPSQVSPTSSMQPQRPQSAQLPVMAHMDQNPTPLALKRPPSAHSNQPASLGGNRDRPGRPPSHTDMRPPSLPSELLPPDLAAKVSQGQDPQRQGLPPPGFMMVHSEHGPVAIPHSLPPPPQHIQHDPAKSSIQSSGAGMPTTATVTSPSPSHLHSSRRGSAAEPVSSKVPPATSAGTLYTGVVAGQPHSLSPKTTSPVGQVIERLPNPMRPMDPLPGGRGPTVAHRPPAPALHQESPMHPRYHKDENPLRTMQPPAAHGEGRAHDLLMMQMLEQQHHQRLQHMIMAEAARSAAAHGAAARTAQEIARSTEASARSAAGQEASRAVAAAQEAARNTAAAAAKEAAARKEAVWSAHEAAERSLQEAGLSARANMEGAHKSGPLGRGQLPGMPPIPSSAASVQQVPLNLADSDSRSGSSDSRERSNGGNKPPPSPFNQPPGYMERERAGKSGDRAPPDSPHLAGGAFVPPPGGAPPGAHRDGLPPPLYGNELFHAPPFGMPVGRMPLDPRLYGGQQHPAPPHPPFLAGREGVLPSPFQQVVGQRFPLDQHPDAERLLKKGEMPPGGMLHMRSPSPIPSPSPRGLPPDMVAHPMMRVEIPVREHLSAVLGRYQMVWQGMLALKNDHSYVQMHFVSGSRDLPDQALPQPVIGGAALPLRISQRMRLETPNLEGVTKRMINEKDYSLLLAVPCGHDHMDISEQTRNLTVGFIEYLRSKLAAGIVNVSHPGTQQVSGVCGSRVPALRLLHGGGCTAQFRAGRADPRLGSRHHHHHNCMSSSIAPVISMSCSCGHLPPLESMSELVSVTSSVCSVFSACAGQVESGEGAAKPAA